MENNKDNNNNEEKKLIQDENKVNDEEVVSEPESITREINLDELYDGAINNTVVIDPVTNNEILLDANKGNRKIIGVFLAILALLILYFVNNKLDIGNDKPNVEPKITSTTSKVETLIKSGVLSCTYKVSGTAESQSASFNAVYEGDNIINSDFSYVVVLNNDATSEIVEDLKGQYENFFINNVSVEGSNISFEKDEKGFTFKSKVDYQKLSFDKIIVEEGKTILYAKPTKSDNLKSLQDLYVNKGYNCNLLSNEAKGEEK